jgi:hypothetical protein
MTAIRSARVVAGLGGVVLAFAVTVATLDVAAQGAGVPLHRPAPDITGGPWINSAPLSTAALRGRVVFVEFWTYG